MKALITGSNGYIGSSFINQYKDKYTFERFSLTTQQLENIDLQGIDVVLHCAALVHQKIEHSYEKYYEINVEYPIKLAKLAKENGVKQFVFMSTIAVYGDEEKQLFENTVCNPISDYGKSKLEAEKQLLVLNDETFTVSIIRAPMVYGKGAPGNIDSLVKLVKKIPIIPFGKINNRRSFVYVGNLCHLVDIVIEQRAGGVFLASDDKSVSTTKLVELIAKELNKKVYLIKVPFFEILLKLLKPSFHKRLYGSLGVDNTITKEKLDLKNPYSVENGIKFMIHGEK